MNQVDIHLDNVEEAVKFVKCLEQHPYNMDLYCGSNVVDAKSLVGVLDMAVGKDVKLCIYEDFADDVIAEMKSFQI